MSRFELLCLFACCLSVAGAATAAQPAVDAPVKPLRLEPCHLPGLDEEVRCGTYEVFENRASRQGRTIPLRVVVLPATGPAPKPDAVVFFAGGPGGSTVEEGSFLASSMRAAREERDFLLVDYRGSGASAPLFCAYQQEARGPEEALESFIPVGELAACRASLSQHADLTLYTTPNIVDDVDEVRAALGYPQVNLVGGSYGTRAAMVYLRRHPEAVRTMVIEGVAPTDADMPESFARDAQTAFDGVVRECAEDADCQRAFPDPAGDLAAVLAAVEKAPPVVDVRAEGGTRPLRLSRPVIVQTLRYMLYQVPGSLQVPAYLHAAAAGDFAPLAQVAYTVAGGLMASLPDGLYLSVTCTEDVPFIDTEAALAEARGTFLGDFRLRAQQAACAAWPRGSLPAGFRKPVRSDKPVLIISGERDPVTPARWGAEAARHLPNSRHLVVPDGAHSPYGLVGVECIDLLVADLLRSGSTRGLDIDGCRSAISRRPFLLTITKDEEITLDEAALARFAGSFDAAAGPSLEVVLEDGVLRGRMIGQDLALTPVGAMRFRPEGAPPGTYIVFTGSAEGGITGASVETAGGSPLELSKRQ